jgi:hypothetical protein
MKEVPVASLTIVALSIPIIRTGHHPGVVVHGYRPDKIVRRYHILSDCHTQFSWLCTTSSSPSIQPIQHLRQQDRLFLSRMNNNDCDLEHIHNRRHPLTNIGAILQDKLDDHVGAAFAQSGSAWLEKDWEGVTVALEEASLAISQHIRDTTSLSADAILPWPLIAQELKDISTIEGCSSVGPPASIPNWLSIQAMLRSFAASDSQSSIKQDDWVEKVAIEIDRLVDSI